MLEHGGRLNQAVKEYAIEKDVWLDLSTGINPNGWSVPEIPPEIYNRLPETDDGLLETAQSYYQVQKLLAVSGSQEAIQLLPQIFQGYGLINANPVIGIISPCYGEHEYQWQKQQCSIVHLTTETIDDSIDSLDVLIVVNPNNPTGEMIAIDTIVSWQQQLEKTQAFLIIDEAFMDSTPEQSILPHMNANPATMNNLIVLRSVGKFFGLAGLRCGFVMASAKILALLQYHQGPWPLSGPTRWLVKKALADNDWIKHQRKFLEQASRRLELLLRHYLITDETRQSIAGTTLFKTVLFNNASSYYQKLARNGVLVRLLDNGKGLRFGLPASENQWQKLEMVLDTVTAKK